MATSAPADGTSCDSGASRLQVGLLTSPQPPPPEKGALDALEHVSSPSRGFPTGARPLAGPGMATVVIALVHEGSAAWKVTWGTRRHEFSG